MVWSLPFLNVIDVMVWISPFMTTFERMWRLNMDELVVFVDVFFDVWPMMVNFGISMEN